MSESKATTGIEVQCQNCTQMMPFELKQESCECPHCHQSMNRPAAILDFLKTLMASTFQFDREKIFSDSQLREIGDSLGTIEMLMKLENEFGIVIGHEDIEELDTVGQVADYISKRLAA